MDKINSIQYLRGVAAIAIVFRHLADRTEKYNITTIFSGLDIGLWGVDLFFVISGFVMVFITANGRQRSGIFRSIVNFWLRRYLRISPIYYILTIVVLVVAKYLPGSTELKPGFQQILFSFLYIPNEAAPVLGVGWTLNYEMYFYFIFGLSLLLPSNLHTKCISFYFIFAVLCGKLSGNNNEFIYQITNPLLIDFLFGIYIAKALKARLILSVRQSYFLMFCSILSILIADYSNIDQALLNEGFRVLCYGLPSAGLVSAVIMLEYHKELKFDLKLPLLLGDVSYSLYLVHILVIAAYGKLVTRYELFGYVNEYVLYFGDLFFCVLIAYLLFIAIERPLHNLTRAFKIV